MSDNKKESRHLFGLYTLLITFGVKLVPIFLKFFKLLKAGKVTMAGLSLGAYSFLFTWEFAIALMLMLFIHEYGHVWAMKRRGMDVKGMYFIPFFGAVAVSNDAFPTRKTEMYTAIMGPIWGFACCLAIAGVYFTTENPMFAGISSMLAFINLFNLIPVNPLDGGRIAKSIAFSLHSWIGIGLLALGFVISGLLAWKLGYHLLLFICILGFFEVFAERRSAEKKVNMTKKELGGAVVCYISIFAALLVLMHSMESAPGAQAMIEILKS